MKKFYAVIGNPPYQDESNGELRNYASPIYNLFLEEAYKIADTVEMIHPARFLFNAGSTPSAWNRKMLDDPHLQVLYYEADSDKVFPGLSTPIKGGVAVTYRNANKDFGSIGTFYEYPQMSEITDKILDDKGSNSFESLMEIVYPRTLYRLTDVLHEEHPEALEKLSEGHAYDVSSNIFWRLPDVFFDDMPEDGKNYIRILGKDGNRRIYKYIRRDYVNNPPNLDSYKLILAQANGSGAFGEALSPSVIGEPGTGTTETFISIGNFKTVQEAQALEKYVKTKFSRSLLSVLKVTQNGNRSVWRLIPLQDFTSDSDIDWGQSIADVDQQLYKKYDLNNEEIEFIETHVKAMD